ncbi:unnamed protein product [[Candida] boidinii]|nr:unnamed protein product [[Candida] boidinii]
MQLPIASSYLKKSPKEKDFISHNLNNNLKKNTSRSFFSLSSTPSPISQKFQSRKLSPPLDQPHNNDITATDSESSRSPSPSSGNTKNPRHERYNSVDQVLTTNIDEEMGTDKFENNAANGLYSRPTILKMANSTVGSSTQSSITASDTNSPDCIARNISTSPSSNISEAYNTDTTDKDNIGASTRNIDPSTNIKPDVNIAGQFSTVNNQSSSDISNNSGTDLSSNSNGISNNTATFDNKKQLFRENRH